MPKTDPRVDAYIAKSAPFAQPILKHLRKLAHQAVPDATETIKWGMPVFMHHGLLGHFAAFREHAVLSFWNGMRMKDAALFRTAGRAAMGHVGRITSLKELPSDKVILGWFKEAAALNEAGVKPPKTRKTAAPRKPAPVPADLKARLAKSAKAKKTFDALPPSGKRDYIEWLTEAKTDATRKKRLDTTIEWLEEGKGRNWKYQQRAKAS